jgi:integrase
VAVKQAKKPGYYSDGAGLVLQITPSRSKSWLFRYRSPAGRIREMGLGSVSTVSLSDARRFAEQAQRHRAEGLDPLDVKRQRDAHAKIEAAKGVTFKWCAERFIASNASGWSNSKHASQWSATLATYAYPVFGNLPVASVDTALVTKALEPIWNKKTETASRLRQRIERVLSWAAVSGYRSGANPAAWRGHLDHVLPKPSKVRKVEHHAALSIDAVPAFMEALAGQSGTSALAFRFLLLTASRTANAIGARWSDIDMAKCEWTIPSELMKAKAEHRVPLSDAAMDILREAESLKTDSGVVFPGARPGRPLSNMAFTMLLRRMERTDFVPHGLRSTFRTWAAERTTYPREVCEAALAHTIGSETELAYMRSDFFEKRRDLMDMWGRFATTPIKAIGKLVDLRSGGA